MSDLERYLKTDSVPNGWCLDPIIGAILFIGDEAIFGGITKRAIGALSLASTYLPMATTHPELNLDNEGKLAFLRLAKQYEQDCNLAKSIDLEKDNYDRLNKHSLVSIWNVFETSLEDLFIGLIINEPESYEKLSSLNLKIKSEKFKCVNSSQASFLVKKIRQDQYFNNKNFIEFYETVFACFKIQIDEKLEEKNTIVAIKEIRNCIVHRKGFVDDSTIKKVLYLRDYYGKTIIVTEEEYRKYHKILGDYLTKLFNALLKSPYMYKKSM